MARGLYVIYTCSTSDSRINPLSLVEILAFVIQQYTDWKEAVSFLEKMEVKVKGCEDAVMLCKVLEGQILLEKLSDTVATKVPNVYRP